MYMVDDGIEKGEQAFKRVERDLNQEGRELVFDLAERARSGTIKQIFEAFKENIIKDRNLQLNESKRKHPSASGGQLFESFLVTSDFLAAPFIDGEPQECMAMRLEWKRDPEQDDDSDDDYKGEDSIIVYMVQPPDFSVSRSDVDTLKQPDTIFVARNDGKGNITRFRIRKEEIMSYIGMDDQEGGQIIEMDDERLIERLHRPNPVESTLSDAGKLIEDLVNMKVVPQRKSTE